MGDMDKILEALSDIRIQQSGINAKQDATHEGIQGIHKRLDILNGRVYTLEEKKADKTDLTALSSRVWKIVLIMLGGGGAAAVSIKELFFK